jgi:signal transduction histidine kinase
VAGGRAQPVVDLDDLPDGVLVADDAGRVVAFNRAAQRITGLAAADVLGKPLADALPLEDPQGRRWWVCVDPYGGLAIRRGTPERCLRLPGGPEVLVTTRFHRPGRGEPPTRVVVGLRDTTARVRLERDRAELVSSVAHELRSPLTSVKGFTTTLLAKWYRFSDEQRRLMLETVAADTDRVARLLTELLDVARFESGRLELRRAPIDLPRVVIRHVDGLVAAGQPRDRFAVEVREPLPVVWADGDKVDQVLANLLENALRHGAGQITVRVEPEDGVAAAVSVLDQGPGVPESARTLVFARFWRSRSPGGTGLGLYIVRALVEAHGGAVAVTDAPGGGACFRFTLPAGAPDPG